MRITKYKTELDQNLHNVLVKESAVNYQCTSTFDKPELIANMLTVCYGLNRCAEEYMYLIALSTKGKILGVFEVFHGAVDTSLCNPREIFIRLLLCGACSFVLAHNHPSGDCTPSEEDLHVTIRLKKCAEMMGISFLDHIIIAGNTYISFKSEKLMDTSSET